MEYHIENSFDALNFNDIATITSKGDGTNSYTYLDKNLLNSTVYYRVKQISPNGMQSFSNIVKLNIDVALIKIFNNPTTNYLRVLVNNNLLNTTAQLYSVNGQLLKIFKIESLSFTIDLSEYANGVFFLRTINGVEKLIKQ